MARNANNQAGEATNKVEQDILADGSYPARIVQIVFLGVQDQRAFQGQPKPPCDSVRITYELSHEFMKDENGDVLADKPRWESETIAFKNATLDLATSTKRYKAYRPQAQPADFVWDEGLLGTAVQVQLKGRKVETGRHAGKTFVDIKGVTPPANMPGYEQPVLINLPVFFDPEDDAVSVDSFNEMPEWLQGEVKKAHNWDAMPLAGLLAGGTTPSPKAAPAPQPAPQPADDPVADDDDTPY